jgi:hypothetical protein
MLSDARLRDIVGEEDFSLYQQLLKDPKLKMAIATAMCMEPAEGCDPKIAFVLSLMKGHIVAVAHLLRMIHCLQVELIEKEADLLSLREPPIDIKVLIESAERRHNLMKYEPASASTGLLTRIRTWRPWWIKR